MAQIITRRLVSPEKRASFKSFFWLSVFMPSLLSSINPFTIFAGWFFNIILTVITLSVHLKNFREKTHLDFPPFSLYTYSNLFSDDMPPRNPCPFVEANPIDHSGGDTDELPQMRYSLWCRHQPVSCLQYTSGKCLLHSGGRHSEKKEPKGSDPDLHPATPAMYRLWRLLLLSQHSGEGMQADHGASDAMCPWSWFFLFRTREPPISPFWKPGH